MSMAPRPAEGLAIHGIRGVVTDIEGTTSSIRFVHDILFPYAAAHLPAFVRAHHQSPAVRHALDETARIGGVPTDDLDGLIDCLQNWIRQDRKITPLKALQGQVWKEGYARGAFRGHVYPDVPDQLRRWHAEGLALAVYSSGSVEAQKLIFGHSEAGDLCPLFHHFFDTRVGAKREVTAYRSISAAIKLDPAELLFLSDVPAELEAAAEAGWHGVQLVRDEQTEAQTRFPVAQSFAEIHLIPSKQDDDPDQDQP